MSADISPDLRRRIAKAAAKHAAAKAQRQVIAGELAAVAREAINAGMTERDLAAALGVDRARTLRRMLGK
jgi:hypothetical protein